MKKYMLVFIILLFLIILMYLSTEKQHVVNVEDTNNKIVTKYPSWTISRLSGSSIVKYFTMLSEQKIDNYYNNLANDFSEKGYIEEKIEGYIFYFDSQTSTYYFIPEINYIEKRSMLITQYHIENLFIDVIDLDYFKK